MYKISEGKLKICKITLKVKSAQSTLAVYFPVLQNDRNYQKWLWFFCFFESKRSETTKIQFKASQERLGFLNMHFITRPRKQWRLICCLLIYEQLRAKVSPLFLILSWSNKTREKNKYCPLPYTFQHDELAHWGGASPAITSSHWGLKETPAKRERPFSGEGHWWVVIFCLCQIRGSEQGHFALNQSQYKRGFMLYVLYCILSLHHAWEL